MAEYQEKVSMIKEGVMVYGEEQKTEQKKKQNEEAENNNAEINKEQNLQKDKEIFTRIMSGLQKKDEKQKDAVPEKIWDAAINICSSYDHKYAEKEDALLARKQDLQKETEFMNRLAVGDVSGVFKFTVDKLAELSKQGITVEKCINQTEIEKNPEGYTKLASVIKVMNHLRKNLNDDNIGIVLGNTSFFKDKTALMESLLTISNLADYDNYLARAKEFKSLDERQQKAFKNREYRMQRRNERLKLEFFENVEICIVPIDEHFSIISSGSSSIEPKRSISMDFLCPNCSANAVPPTRRVFANKGSACKLFSKSNVFDSIVARCSI